MAILEDLVVRPSSKSERPPKPKPVNPIEGAIKLWLDTLPPVLLESIDVSLEVLVSAAPKRWVVYPPMVLLPAGSFGEDWWDAVGHHHLVSTNRDSLWTLILKNIGNKEGKGTLTHLAVNSGIPLHKVSNQGLFHPEATEHKPQSFENILRTPSGLSMLYGDFGSQLSPEQEPSEKDFEEAFWVSTKQNGITQIWAPRYTMFSRGNVKEKARLLDFHKASLASEARMLSKAELASGTAVDFYAGIGYFVFSYVKMGMGRVIGWELNPWSVEGLRRGAIANGWSVKVVKDGGALEIGEEQIVVLSEDNQKAAGRIRQLSRVELGEVRHVNCGLLPTSEMTWEMALEIMEVDGWLHLHENVGVNDVQDRRSEIDEIFRSWLINSGDQRVASVEHVELVKTFAPGVWHCVFDVYVQRREHPLESL